MIRFKDRKDAGLMLAERLQEYAGREDALVLALPRGGVPVAFEVAKKLDLPMDVFLVRKLGLPGREELAMGAIAAGGFLVLNETVVNPLKIPTEVIDKVAQREQAELERRDAAYRDDLPPPDVKGKTVLLVDDGLATGATMRAAVMALREREPAEIVIAVPVASPETFSDFEDGPEVIICSATPHPFYGVGMWYDDFSQTTDDEVRDLLQKAADNRGEK